MADILIGIRHVSFFAQNLLQGSRGPAYNLSGEQSIEGKYEYGGRLRGTGNLLTSLKFDLSHSLLSMSIHSWRHACYDTIKLLI